MPEPGNLAPGEGGRSGGNPGRFGDLLLACRRAAGLTQEDLAARSGLSVRGISDLERGHASAPQRRSAELLGEALSLTGAALAEFLDAARSSRPRRAPAPMPGGPGTLTGAWCSLPIDVADFTARHRELDGLRAVAGRAAGEDAGPAQVVAISGHPGVGKTALAVHAGHLLAGTFPDAQMYVDLRGTDERPVTAEAALGRLLRALGLPDERIPVEAADRESLYRSLTHDRQVLVVLDNAANEAQVRPLLLAGDRCLTVITSRRVLAGLAAVTQLPLDVLPAQMAIGLLRDIVGRGRMGAEPAAARAVARLCGGLPLALRIAGNRLVSRPSWTIGYLAGQLGDERRRLEVLAAGDLALRSAFTTSYQQLTPAAATVFRRLALVPGPDFGAGVAAVLAGADQAAAQAALDELADASLLEPASAPGRQRFHDLIRLFAAACLDEEEAAEERRAAEGRMLTALIGAAIRAGRLIGPPGEQPWAAAPPDESLASFARRSEAVSWLDAEFANWFGAARRCAAASRHADVLGLAWALHWYAEVRQRRGAWAELFTLALAAARELGDRWQVARMLNFLGWTAAVAGRWDDAARHHREALRLVRGTGHREEEAWSLNYLGMARGRCESWDAAVPLVTSAVEIFDAIGYGTGQCIALTNLASSVARSGRPAQAVSHLDKALAIAAEAGYLPSYAMVLTYKGLVLADLGRWQDAADAHRAAIPVLQAEGNLHRLARSFQYLGLAEIGLGNPGDAAGHLRHAFELFAELSDQQSEEAVLRVLERVQGSAVSPA